MRTHLASRADRRRSGFTLVELLVVMSVISVLSTMAIFIVPSLSDKQSVSRGADQFQGWLLIAKQRAVRDQAPRGVRISQDLSGNYTVVQYIEQPDDYAPDGTLTVTPIGNAPNADSTAKLVATPGIDTGLVGVGDYVQLSEGSSRQTYRIVTPMTATNITLNSNVQSAETQRQLANVPMNTALTPINFVNTPATKQFRFVRAVRPMAGELTQQLPVSVAINGGSSSPSFAGTPFDIVFMPSGQLQNATQGTVIVRLDPVNVTGASTLIVIYARTGAIASHPIADGADPFQFVRDGQDSGL